VRAWQILPLHRYKAHTPTHTLIFRKNKCHTHTHPPHPPPHVHSLSRSIYTHPVSTLTHTHIIYSNMYIYLYTILRVVHNIYIYIYDIRFPRVVFKCVSSAVRTLYSLAAVTSHGVRYYGE